MRRVLAKGGAVFWRSAAKKPWYVSYSTLIQSGRWTCLTNAPIGDYRYISKFTKNGFYVEALSIREGNVEPIDRVNMVRPLALLAS